MTFQISVLDIGCGNIQSVINALLHLGYSVKQINQKQDIDNAQILIFPGVGSFAFAMRQLRLLGLVDALKEFIAQGKPFMGICVGMQVLFDASEESLGVSGLSVLKGSFELLKPQRKSVPAIGWNSISSDTQKYYFVHSYALKQVRTEAYTVSKYDQEVFVSSVWHENVYATQFHPEKSGQQGLALLKQFVERSIECQHVRSNYQIPQQVDDQMLQRIVACLDVRSDDDGKLVVTKGDQYKVRENGIVRNLGDPVQMAKYYYEQGIDELVFLQITQFREKSLPMKQVLLDVSKNVFVPIVIGGGIKDCEYGTALDVAEVYFRSGADKVSIGSDAVKSALSYYETGSVKSSINDISSKYGKQAVVISIDAKRVVTEEKSLNFTSVAYEDSYCHYLCTVKGGRELVQLDVVQLIQAVETMGAGELLVNCIDNDGQNNGFDLDLMRLVKQHTKLPVIASSGAGKAAHFKQLFEAVNVEAALAAGIFHRQEVTIAEVKQSLN